MLFRLKVLVLAAAAAVLCFCGWLFWFALSPIQLVEAGVPLSEWKFVLLARINGAGGAVKAGSYQVTDGITPLLLIRKLVRGEYAQAEIVFPEGWTFRQMRELMDAHQDLKHDTASLNEAEIMEKISEPDAAAEGLF